MYTQYVHVDCTMVFSSHYFIPSLSEMLVLNPANHIRMLYPHAMQEQKTLLLFLHSDRIYGSSVVNFNMVSIHSLKGILV